MSYTPNAPLIPPRRHMSEDIFRAVYKTVWASEDKKTVCEIEKITPEAFYRAVLTIL